MPLELRETLGKPAWGGVSDGEGRYETLGRTCSARYKAPPRHPFLLVFDPPQKKSTMIGFTLSTSSS